MIPNTFLLRKANLLLVSILVLFIVFTNKNLFAAANQPGIDIFEAVRHDDVEAMGACIRDGCDINKKDSAGNTPLHIASIRGCMQTAEMLISHGADVDVKSSCYGSTPLHVASSFGRAQIVEKLINHGAGIDAQNIERNTPLHIAVIRGFMHVVKMLIRHGADVNVQNQSGKTPLDIAYSDREGFKQVLINAGAKTGEQIRNSIPQTGLTH